MHRSIGVADDFRKWLGSSGFRMFQRLNEKHSRAVAADETATVGVKRPRQLLDGNAWLFGQCVEETEGFDDDGGRLVAAARDERVLLAKKHLLIGQSDGLQGGGACGARGKQDSVDAEVVGDIERGRMGDDSEKMAGGEVVEDFVDESGYRFIRFRGGAQC